MAKRRLIAELLRKNELKFGKGITVFEAKKTAKLTMKLLREAQKDGMTLDEVMEYVEAAKRAMAS